MPSHNTQQPSLALPPALTALARHDHKAPRAAGHKRRPPIRGRLLRHRGDLFEGKGLLLLLCREQRHAAAAGEREDVGAAGGVKLRVADRRRRRGGAAAGGPVADSHAAHDLAGRGVRGT